MQRIGKKGGSTDGEECGKALSFDRQMMPLHFRKKAEEAGMTESDYFRLLITQQPSDYPEIRGGIKVLINEVNRIGVNINEIVFNNNSNLYRTADKERLIALYAAFE